MSNLPNELSSLIIRESENEKRIDQLITDAPEETLGDLLYIAVRELSLLAATKVLARQPDVMKLMTIPRFSKTPTPVHFYLCDDDDYMFTNDEEDFEEKRLALLQLLLKHNAEPNWQGKNGGPLDAAIQNSNEALIKCLLAAGADINQTKIGSALNVAIKSIDDEQKRKDIMQLLLASGADVNGDAAYRPILTAARKDQIDTIQFLLNAGADLYIRNENGKNMLDLAAEYLQQNIIDFCASKNWHLDAEQQILLDYTLAAKNLDYPAIYEISKRFPENRLEQSHMISFSYAATQVKQHQDAIAWVQKAVNHRVNNLAVNRYIAAWVYASKFSEAINCFETYQDQVALKDLDNFAQANLLVAALQTNNQPLLETILDTIRDCVSTEQGAGLLYFNAACVTSLQHKLEDAFKFLVAARLNNFKTSSIDTDSDLEPIRELTEFYVLQDWKNVGGDSHRIYDNDKELWYFREKLFEIDFAEQRCDEIELEAGNSTVDKAMAVCFALRDYERQGNNSISRESAAVNSLCEDITTAMMEVLDSDDGENYKGVGFEWNLGSDPLNCQWWAYGITENDDWDDLKNKFTSYFWCDDTMYQQLVESIRGVTQDLFQNREFFIQLGRDSDERSPIQIGSGSD
jgi:Ankyrin repeats (3 copies)